MLRQVAHENKKGEQMTNKIQNKFLYIKNEIFKDKWKIKLNKTEKMPLKNVNWKNKNNHYKQIDDNKYNVGILTGKINNLLLVDVDKKKDTNKEKDGLQALNNYICGSWGDIDTFTVKAPNDGFHYYFKLDSDDEDIRYILLITSYIIEMV